MTGWYPIPQLAGHRRDRSLEPQMTRSKRGRPIKKTEAMTSSDAAQWRKAALEEIRSWKEAEAIKIIDRSKLPKRHTLMK